MRGALLAACFASCLALAAASIQAQEPGAKKGPEPVPGPKAAASFDPNCSPPCVATFKTCVPVPAVKVKKTWVYGCKEVDFCLPRCSGLFSRCNDSCAGGNCESPRTKRVLMKRLCTEECPTFKCEVEERVGDTCPSGHGLLPGHHHNGTGANVIVLPHEPAPAPRGAAAKPLPR